MSHARPLPEAATPPYPAHPAPHVPAAPAPPPHGATAAVSAEAAPGEGRTAKWLAAGAAIGVGSAAIVAAALYAGRQGKRSQGVR